MSWTGRIHRCAIRKASKCGRAQLRAQGRRAQSTANARLHRPWLPKASPRPCRTPRAAPGPGSLKPLYIVRPGARGKRHLVSLRYLLCCMQIALALFMRQTRSTTPRNTASSPASAPPPPPLHPRKVWFCPHRGLAAPGPRSPQSTQNPGSPGALGGGPRRGQVAVLSGPAPLLGGRRQPRQAEGSSRVGTLS